MVLSIQFFQKFRQNDSLSHQKVGERHIHKKTVNSIVLKLQVIYSLTKYQSGYHSVSYEPTALKICHVTEHQKLDEKHISVKNLSI